MAVKAQSKGIVLLLACSPARRGFVAARGRRAAADPHPGWRAVRHQPAAGAAAGRLGRGSECPGGAGGRAVRCRPRT